MESAQGADPVGGCCTFGRLSALGLLGPRPAGVCGGMFADRTRHLERPNHDIAEIAVAG
jgi:hypothetical protein